MTLRTFIAVEVGPVDEILKFEQEIKNTRADVKLVELENIHITLKFLGDTEEEQIDDIVKIIEQSCQDISPFTLEFKAAGVFPNLNYIKILWIGISGFEPLEKIANKLNSNLNKLGFKSEKRGFRPHITVGRVKSKKNKNILKELILKNKTREFGKLKVERVILKKSVLDSKGPTYYDLGEVELK